MSTEVGAIHDLVIPFSELESRYGKTEAEITEKTLVDLSLPEFIQEILRQYRNHCIWNEAQQKICLNPMKLKCFFTGDLYIPISDVVNTLIERYGDTKSSWPNKEDIPIIHFLHRKALLSKKSFTLRQTQSILKCSYLHILSIKEYIEATGLRERYCAERISLLVMSFRGGAILLEQDSIRETGRLIALNSINTRLYLFEDVIKAIFEKKIGLYRSTPSENLAQFFVSYRSLRHFRQSTNVSFTG